MRHTKYSSRLGSLVVGLAMTIYMANVSAIADSVPQAPIAPYTLASGGMLSTAQLKGHATMLWLLSTWCGSCAAGLQAMADNAGQLEKTGLHVVILRNYQNGGYPGQNIHSFVNRVAPELLNENNWAFGEATLQLEHAYNHKHYPDIYFLIDASGHVRAIDSAPAATMDKILNFARAGQGR